ncbi:MAG: HAMP domain-containing protein [Pseudobdellovibrionaceae bacterium]|nr:HAMP domain-containing protein [Bdellovibrionales bacterium]USN48559.1 MAG: HAMP domain-containing protein [Pseudobdellovibrionaceae bacterium]
MKHKAHINIPISFKLITLTMAIVAAVAVPIALKSVQQFEAEFVQSQKQTNIAQAGARADDVERLFVSYVDKIKVIATLVQQMATSGKKSSEALDLTFRRDNDLVSVEVITKDGKDPVRVVNEEFLKRYNLGANYIDQIKAYQKQYKTFHEAAVFAGSIEIRNASLKNGAPLFTVGIPFIKDDYNNVSHIAVANIRMDGLQKVFRKKDVRWSYLVDKDGRLLAHPEEEWVFDMKSMAEVGVVARALKNPEAKSQQQDIEEEGKEYTAAYSRTAIGPIVVVQASKDSFLAVARSVKRSSIKFTGWGLSAAIFVIFVFSLTLTSPIERLVDAAKKVAQGDFSVQSNVRSWDEVGQLSSAFDEMVLGLQERDKMKNVLNKFHGSSVAEDMLKGDLQLGGSRKKVTVFFSDIRDFTKFSEGHTPEQVVEMLNEYFQIMVGIINRHKGVVDKFVGDAIMAVWGAPEPTDRDSYNAVRACVEMRRALGELNKIRTARGEVPLKIGMGLHTGYVISGTIGSDERMEYTVIGDAVNQAARIEASTKAFGADLLLSDEIADTVHEEFILEKAGSAEVKGKSKPLTLFKVRGYIENGEEVRVQTEYSDYEAESADKVKVAS